MQFAQNTALSSPLLHCKHGVIISADVSAPAHVLVEALRAYVFHAHSSMAF